ncbi:PP2C family protein-serine/threonine phosphatase [Phaeacidiphilus oryzae]|uniref:PP2C family protein-serine/threonine phosphatase n=1 Tax=Phaeacidiphilus oryzae TaxID=348818 RepID=UPI0006906577|nr:PP2C family protein-serine/threonine phosphatase [Phaeacidiphilus oryzae]
MHGAGPERRGWFAARRLRVWRRRAGGPGASLRPYASWRLPAVLTAAIIGLDLAFDGRFRTDSWLVLVPVVASAFCSTAVTFWFACLVAALYLPMEHLWAGPHRMGLEDLLLVLVGSAIAVPVAWLRSRTRGQIERLANAASVTRQIVLRPFPPGVGGLSAAASYLPADKEARVGGDFYEVLATPWGARVLLGDVQGKGLSAVGVAAALVGTFRECGWTEEDLDALAGRLEVRAGRINRYQSQFGETDHRFATGVLVEFRTDDPERVRMVNFGHEGPFAIGPAGVRRLPQEQGPPLGLADLVGERARAVDVPFGPGEALLLVTDGVTEARNRRGRFLPLEERLTERWRREPGGLAQPGRLVAVVEDAVLAHTAGRLADDTAILAVRRLPGPATAGTGSAEGSPEGAAGG